MLKTVPVFYEPTACTEAILDASFKCALERIQRENINFLNPYTFDLALEQAASHFLSMHNTYPRNAFPRMLEHGLKRHGNKGNWRGFKQILRAHQRNLIMLVVQDARRVLTDVMGGTPAYLEPHKTLEETKHALGAALESHGYKTWEACAWYEVPSYVLHAVEACLRALYTWLCVSLAAEHSSLSRSRAHYWFTGPENHESKCALEQALQSIECFGSKETNLTI